MASNFKQDLINELSALSLSLSDGLERVSEADLESNQSNGKQHDKSAQSKKAKANPKNTPDTEKA